MFLNMLSDGELKCTKGWPLWNSIYLTRNRLLYSVAHSSKIWLTIEGFHLYVKSFFVEKTSSVANSSWLLRERVKTLKFMFNSYSSRASGSQLQHREVNCEREVPLNYHSQAYSYNVTCMLKKTRVENWTEKNNYNVRVLKFKVQYMLYS